jgi:hypothetical protein
MAEIIQNGNERLEEFIPEGNADIFAPPESEYQRSP